METVNGITTTTTTTSTTDNNRIDNNDSDDETYEYVSLAERISSYQKKLEAEQRKLEKPCRTKSDYGRPLEGSQTQLRGIKAYDTIAQEIRDLCSFIETNGTKNEDNQVTITFGQLFESYEMLSNKLVGILLRACKQGFVHFVGEILYQRRDENVVITLIKMPPEDFKLTY
ncbi:actin-binding Rho-activating protein-like [Panonychus citri]|uniref:actin-binding Rho-activating protein-like n=1 Tax=Panonychus citri TaxID=50023 RepID=UPI0023082F3B|nr:actin-binding Rho-activating protein-like [Panonychus citri]